MKQINFNCKKLAALFILIFGCVFLNFQYISACDNFTLCEGFSYEKVPDDYELPVENKDKFEKNKYIRREDLRLLKIKHVDLEGKIKESKLIVAHEAVDPKTKKTTDVSKEVLEIFKELFDAKYPIRETSCFYFRNIAGSDKLSWHAYGLAVDINYRENPCVSIDESTGKLKRLIPDNSAKYIDRSLNEKGMIKKGDACYNAFVKRGWEWGGSWNCPMDYMHFQKFSWDSPRPEAKYN